MTSSWGGQLGSSFFFPPFTFRVQTMGHPKRGEDRKKSCPALLLSTSARAANNGGYLSPPSFCMGDRRIIRLPRELIKR